ncbi:unnamed protein product, partial [marine sediment metagenome]
NQDDIDTLDEEVVKKTGDQTVAGIKTFTGGIRSAESQPALKTKIIDIGDWNMNTTTYVEVAHGLTHTKIRNTIIVLIRNDENTSYLPLIGDALFAGVADGNILINSTNIVLTRKAGALFDSEDFDSTDYNRGWITINYIP